MNKKRTISCALCLATLVSATLSPYAGDTSAKSVKKLKFSKKTVSVNVGKKKTVVIKNKYSKFKATVKNKKIIKYKFKKKKLIITGKKSGKTTLIIKAYKNSKLKAKGKITVNVTTSSSVTKHQDKAVSPVSTPGVIPTTSSTPAPDTASYDAGKYSLNTIHTGDGTFYDRESTGAANLDDFEKIYYTAAMNTTDYMNNLAGAYIEITDKDGDKINVLITDRLPEGKVGDIDLSRAAFKKIEPEVTGRMKISWKIVPLPTTDPVAFLWKPTSSQYWAEIQVRNHRYPVKSLEYYNKSTGKYVALERKEYNYFAAPNGMGTGPYSFRITDIYGHVIEEKNIPMNNKKEVISGKNNFPY
ncbi:expansin EXLX1 family cellulose-binding protein [Eubacterium xylanophilum]|uniref:expansin EXLX1 family cellulose-binding protein n=1 Tax=Eubacterium xylanophilum TaxID=39497 RepID=UPI0004B197FE|nr:expansin EXLX1 family cellulose-binding protein [Eubacterium xylanophilum]